MRPSPGHVLSGPPSSFLASPPLLSTTAFFWPLFWPRLLVFVDFRWLKEDVSPTGADWSTNMRSDHRLSGSMVWVPVQFVDFPHGSLGQLSLRSGACPRGARARQLRQLPRRTARRAPRAAAIGPGALLRGVLPVLCLPLWSGVPRRWRGGGHPRLHAAPAVGVGVFTRSSVGALCTTFLNVLECPGPNPAQG